MSDILRKRATMQTVSSGRDVNQYGVSMIQPLSPLNREQGDERSVADSDTFHTASDRTFEIATEKGGRKPMSEEEVNMLVHNALRRARQATNAISPRHRSILNPLSPRMAMSPPAMSSPRPPLSDSKYLGNQQRGGGPASQLNNRPGSSSDSGDPYFYTTTVESNMSNISCDGSDFQQRFGDEGSISPSEEDSSSEQPMVKTVTSSEAIIRRVEEEIANARKAAQEANRRLAGVSANLHLGLADPPRLMELESARSQTPEIYDLPNDPSDEINLPVKPQPSVGSTGASVGRNISEFTPDSPRHEDAAERDGSDRFDRLGSRGTDHLVETRNSSNLADQVSNMTEDGVDHAEELLDQVLNGPSPSINTPQLSDDTRLNPSSHECKTERFVSKDDSLNKSLEVETSHLESERTVDDADFLISPSHGRSVDDSSQPQEQSNMGDYATDQLIQEEKRCIPKTSTPKSHLDFHSHLSAEGNLIMRILAQSDQRPRSLATPENAHHELVGVNGSCHEVIDLTKVGSEGTGGPDKPLAQEPNLSGESTATAIRYNTSTESSNAANLEYEAPEELIETKYVPEIENESDENDFRLKYPALAIDDTAALIEDYVNEKKCIKSGGKYGTPISFLESVQGGNEAEQSFGASTEKVDFCDFKQRYPVLPVQLRRAEKERDEICEHHASASFKKSNDEDNDSRHLLGFGHGTYEEPIEVMIDTYERSKVIVQDKIVENASSDDIATSSAKKSDFVVAPKTSADGIEESNSDAATEAGAKSSSPATASDLNIEVTTEIEAGSFDNKVVEPLENVGEPGDLAKKTTKTVPEESVRDEMFWSSLDDIVVDEKSLNKDVDAPKGENPTPTAPNQPDMNKTARSNKVRFKQRYPVPPASKKSRSVEEIVRDHRVAPSGNALFLSMPKSDLSELLQAAVGSSLQRRSNACGALKVLTTQKKNQLMLVRTAGFLDALVFATNEKISKVDIDPALDARTRAVAAICNVCGPKDNREIVLKHPGLIAALIKTIVEDKAEARTEACGGIALLAKTPSNREALAQTKNLVTALSIIVQGGKSSFGFDEETKPTFSDESFQQSYSSASESSSSSSSSLENDSSLSNDAEEEKSQIITVRSIRKERKSLAEETAMRGQMNACAALLHLSKDCGATLLMCSNADLMDALVDVSQREDDPKQIKCLEILCNLSRLPVNNETMAKYPGLVDALVFNGGSSNYLDRVWSLRTIQNISTVVTGKTVLANRTVLELLSYSVMREILDEQLAATATIYNLSTEPGAVVPLTNTKNVVATLVHVAHNPDSSSEVRYMACDALATLGLWMQTLAGAGTVPNDMNQNVTLPSYVTSGWMRWD